MSVGGEDAGLASSGNQSPRPGTPPTRKGTLMKRLLALVVTAALAVALYAATAQSGQQAVTPKQFAALTKKVNTIRKDVDAVGVVLVNCVMGTAIPITRYSGFLAVDATTKQQFETTGLDVTNQGDTPNGYMLLVNADQSCIDLINGSSLRKFAAFKPMLRAATKPSFSQTTPR
jgi:hypothetical protein